MKSILTHRHQGMPGDYSRCLFLIRKLVFFKDTFKCNENFCVPYINFFVIKEMHYAVDEFSTRNAIFDRFTFDDCPEEKKMSYKDHNLLSKIDNFETALSYLQGEKDSQGITWKLFDIVGWHNLYIDEKQTEIDI